MSVNVLADLGFADAEDLSAKAILAVKLNELIDKQVEIVVRPARRAHVAGIRRLSMWVGIHADNVPSRMLLSP